MKIFENTGFWIGFWLFACTVWLSSIIRPIFEAKLGDFTLATALIKWLLK